MFNGAVEESAMAEWWNKASIPGRNQTDGGYVTWIGRKYKLVLKEIKGARVPASK